MAKRTPVPPREEPTEPQSEGARPEIIQAIQDQMRALEQQIAATEPLVGKLTSEHISEIIAHAESQSHRLSEERRLRLEQSLADRRQSRVFWGILAGAGLLAFVGLWFLSLAYGKPDLVLELIKWLGGLFGGLVGGYGLGGAGKRGARSSARAAQERAS
jgi:hypothetical protein